MKAVPPVAASHPHDFPSTGGGPAVERSVMQRRNEVDRERPAGADAGAGTVPSLPVLSRRLGRLATVQMAVAALSGVAIAAIVASHALVTGGDAWLAAASLIGMLVTAGLATVAARSRQMRAMLVAAADDLERQSRARASELARANAELARVGRQRSEFFASMSHELRTPLNGILGYSRVLLDDLDGELTSDQREDVAQIHASGQGLLSIVNDVLDFSKLEAGRVTLHREPVHVRTVVDNVLGRVQPLAAEKGLALVNAMPAALPPALADEGRTLQVLLNLVANAIKFTERGSVTVAGGVRDGAIHLSVADTGIGIPSEAQELIFEPFRQADQRDTRRHGGTGLGLAICRQLVGAMGGRVWVESGPGQGSTFRVTLPTVEVGPADDGGATNDAQPIVLAVVGEGEHSSALTRACEGEGLTPVLLDGGTDLRDALTRRHPALALFDVTLPGALGWQAFYTLRADHGAREVPVVLFAANGRQTVGVAVGPTDCLLRPAVSAELLARLGDVVDREAYDGASTGTRTVLLATDDERLGAPAVAQLERGGYDLRRAASGHEALAQLRALRFDAIVLDLLLPGGTLSMLAELRDGTSSAAVPVVLVSPPTLSPAQQRALYQDVLDLVHRRGSDGPPAAGAIRRALAERRGSAVTIGSR